MTIIFLAIIMNLTVNTSGVHEFVPSKSVSTDTIPGERLILYKEDSSIRDDRKSKYLSNVAKNLAISSLNDQKKGMYVRIWIWGYHSPNFVITIYKGSSNFGCQTVSWSGKQIDSARFIVIHRSWNNLVPKSGWNKLLAFSLLNPRVENKFSEWIYFTCEKDILAWASLR
jgi:hypothetical protein